MSDGDPRRPDLGALLTGVVGSLGVGLQDALRALARATPSIGEALLQSARNALREAVPAVAEAARQLAADFAQAMPPNWSRLTLPEVVAAAEFMESTGWSLVWTPPAETVVAVVSAPTADERERLLLGVEGRIVEDLDAVLGRIEQEELYALRDVAAEALETYRSGYFAASQALTGTTLTTAIHAYHGTFGDARRLFRRGLREPDIGVRQFRLVAVRNAVARTLDPYDPIQCAPERPDFNRHATAHRVAEPQYRQVNALSAIMLLTALLVELDGLIALARRAAG